MEKTLADEEELNDLSPEGQMAMKTALSILAGDKSMSKDVIENMPDANVVASSSTDAVDRAIATVEPQHRTEIRHISRRDAIPITEKHVVVMWGNSTYRHEHPRGVTFVVDNSRSNLDRDQGYRDTLLAAMHLARSKGLSFIYVLD